MGMLVDRLRQQPALVEADISGGGADEPRHRVALHVLRHVETDELDAQGVGELPGHLGLADAGGAGKQQRGNGATGIAKP